MAKTKVTLKNLMVYDYLQHIRGDETSVKKIYTKHKDEIAKRFSINTYASFNFHIRKVLDFETTNKYKLDNIRGELDNGKNNT